MTTEATPTCAKLMGSGYLDRHACGKKAKGQSDGGEWLCGVHLGAYNRVKKNDAEWKAKHDANHAERDRVSSLLHEIREQYGLEGRIFGSHEGTYTGEIVVNGQHLLELLTELSAN